MRYRRFYEPGATYFFTVVTGDRRPVFADPENVRLFREAVAGVRLYHPFDTEAEVILPDHLHALWSLPEGDSDFATRWMLIKSNFSRILGKSVGLRKGAQPDLRSRRPARRERSIWQPRYWEHLIRDERDFAAHVEYIHYNPVKHGLVAAPIDWPHSSFREYVEQGLYESHWGSNKMAPLPSWTGKE